MSEHVGKRYGYMTILWKVEHAETLKQLREEGMGGTPYRFKCDCGKLDYIALSSFTRPDKPQVSCGCYKHSEEYAAKISAGQKARHARKKQVHSEETKRKIAEGIRRSHAARGHKMKEASA